MDIKPMEEMTTSVKFNFYKDKTFSVQVCAWESRKGEWHWNVYAFIFDTHKLFGNEEACLDLPFHGGATLENKITTSPAWGIKYEWQKETNTIQLGSDYGHIWDDYDNHPNPADGIPSNIYHDAKALVESLTTTNKE